MPTRMALVVLLGTFAVIRAESVIAQTNPWYVPPANPAPSVGYGSGYGYGSAGQQQQQPANPYGGTSGFTTNSLQQAPHLAAGYQPAQPLPQATYQRFEQAVQQPSYAAPPAQALAPAPVAGPYWSSQSRSAAAAPPAYQQPAYQQPSYQQPAYQQPTYQQPYGDYPPLGSDPTLPESARPQRQQQATAPPVARGGQVAAPTRAGGGASAATNPSVIDPALAAGPSTLTPYGAPYGSPGGYGLPLGSPYGGLAPFPGLPFW